MRPTVLLIDNNTAVADIMRSLLQRNAYNVRVVTHTPDVQEFLSEQTVDVIVSEVEMPVVNGIELGKQLRSDAATADIPLVFLTSLDSLEDEFEGYLAGADAYLTKPFKANDLLSTINKVLDKKQTVVNRQFQNMSVARVLTVSSSEASSQLTDVLAELGFEGHQKSHLTSAFKLLDRELFHLLVVDTPSDQAAISKVHEFLCRFALAVPVLFIFGDDLALPQNFDSSQFHAVTAPVGTDELTEIIQRLVTEFGDH
ncbi:MAG: response regulator [Planctomycetota bacterium]|jgi:DNA-binding response OmpR family regulator